MSPEAPLEPTEHGLLPAADGWFVLNATDAPWQDWAGRMQQMAKQGQADFSQLGVGLYVLSPGQPMSMYHWETDQEDFLVVAGEALLLVEGEERPLRQWDFVHCPAGTNHIILGAGDTPCVVVAVGAQEHQEGDAWGGYTVDEVALRHGAGVEEETSDAEVAYARFPDPRPTRYPEGLLPTD
jgi:uncharacterized cupin superfamily protein